MKRLDRRRRPVATFSVIVPAHNAESTLGETLASICAQTLPHWEAMVVDDRSTDNTRAIAEDWARRDPRFRVAAADHAGVSAARNQAIASSTGDWLVFLDADDLLVPTALEQHARVISADSDVDAVAAGWIRTSPDGEPWSWHRWYRLTDLFHAVSMYCPFQIGSCVVHRSIVDAVGGFDTELAIAADWDLWQRVVRAGSVFGWVEEYLLLYRTQRHSMSVDAKGLFDESRTVIARAHRSDPRVPAPAPRYARGRPPEAEAGALVRVACWAAGLAIGTGDDPLVFLSGLERPDPRHTPLSAEVVAGALKETIRQARALAPWEWPSTWPEVAEPVRTFLQALEALCGLRGLAWRTEMLLDHRARTVADRRGRETAVRVELTEPVRAVVVPEIDRLIAVATCADETLGLLELPVIDGVVGTDVLTDAAAERWGWQLLARVLVAQRVCSRGDPDGRLNSAIEAEVWGGAARRVRAPGRRIEVAAGNPLPDIVADDGAVEVVVTVRGHPIDAVVVGPGTVAAAELFDAIRHALGPEWGRAVAREAAAGRPLDDGSGLAERLRAPAYERTDDLMPRSKIGRRRHGRPGTAALRIAALPAACTELVEATAVAAGEPVVRTAASSGVVYDPDLIAPLLETSPPHGEEHLFVRHDRLAFERLFAAVADPYGDDGHALILTLLEERADRVLDVGCATGRLAVELGQRAEFVVAVDVSQIAVDRARARTAGLGNVDVRRLDVFADPVAGEFDLIVCSQVLGYAPDRETLDRSIARLAGALKPGGRLLVANAFDFVDPVAEVFGRALPHDDSDVAHAMRRSRELRCTREVRTEHRCVRVYERGGRNLWGPARTKAVETAGKSPFAPIHKHRDRPLETWYLTVLLYRAAGTPAGIATETLASHLDVLRDGGVRTISFDRWRAGVMEARPIPGRCIVLVFEDCAQRFVDDVVPLLAERGFTATVLLDPARLDEGLVGSCLKAGIDVGSSFSRQDLIGRSWEHVAGVVSRARAELTKRLQRPPTTFRYPDDDEAVARFIGACGYFYGLTDRPGPAVGPDPLLRLPIVEIGARDSFEDFVLKLAF